jgi:hypothetical protein
VLHALCIAAELGRHKTTGMCARYPNRILNLIRREIDQFSHGRHSLCVAEYDT